MDVHEAKRVYQKTVADRCARLRNPPGDVVECDWPNCGCDPLADELMAKMHTHWVENFILPCPICGGPASKDVPDPEN